MESVRIAENLTKEEARDAITLTIQRFNATFSYVQDDPRFHLYNERFLKVVHKLNDKNYYLNASNYFLSDDFKRLGAQGLTDFLLKLKLVSEKFGLYVAIPQSVKVIGEDCVETFLEELTQYSLNALNNNKTELTNTYNELLSQTNKLNLKNSKQTPLEEIILKSREYKIAKRNADNASTELMNMAASAGSGASYDEKEYARYQQIYNSNTAEMDYIKRNYPLVTFFNGKEDKKTVEKQLGKAYKEINKALDNLIARIHDGKYPIWHFDTLVEQLLEKYEDKDRTVIQTELARMKKKEELTDLLLTIGPMVLSVVLFLIPGGASFILLGLRAGLQVANAAAGVMSAVNDIQDAAIMKDESYASLKISPEVQQLMNKENYDINDAKFQYIVALVSSGFVVFDVMDAVDAFKLIKKCGQLDNATKAVLSQCKRFGENLFETLDVEQLNKLGKLTRTQFDIITDLPTEKIIKILDHPKSDLMLKNIGNLRADENIISKIDDIIDGINKTPREIMIDAGYKYSNVLENEEYYNSINEILENISANELISKIKAQKETSSNKSLGDILKSIRKGSVLRGELITVDNLQKFIPATSSAKSSKIIQKIKTSPKRQEILDYMQELFNQYGSTDQIMQEHHWIKQEYIKNGLFPFLQCPPMKKDLLIDENNLSTIIGHVGSHKGTYNSELYIRLERLRLYFQNHTCDSEKINKMVNVVIAEIKELVDKNNYIMNNRKLYILN